MNLSLDMTLASGYRSAAQRARVLSEGWVANNLSCLACPSRRLDRLPNNKQAADFACPACTEQYELKSGRSIGAKIVNGAYEALVARLASTDNPSLLLLKFDSETTRVRAFDVVPRQFFIPDMVEKRPALKASARRAGWIGSNIRLDRLPSAGRIAVVAEGTIVGAEHVRAAWTRAGVVRVGASAGERTWMMTVLRLVDGFGEREFTLVELYGSGREIADRFPANRHPEAKIRQCLQRLRDRGLLSFLGAGRYRRLP